MLLPPLKKVKDALEKHWAAIRNFLAFENKLAREKLTAAGLDLKTVKGVRDRKRWTVKGDRKRCQEPFVLLTLPGCKKR